VETKNIFNAVKLLMWMNMPSHHQKPFFDALRDCDVDSKVLYYGSVSKQRVDMGWSDVKNLPENEHFVSTSAEGFAKIPDWRERIHVVPGYGDKILRSLTVVLSKERVRWIHWSEPAHPGLRWWASFPLKLWYARIVNASALGAFGTGIKAVEDIGSVRISQRHNTMFCFRKCLQEVFMDAPAALVERAGAAVSTSFKGKVFTGNSCPECFRDLFMPDCPKA